MFNNILGNKSETLIKLYFLGHYSVQFLIYLRAQLNCQGPVTESAQIQNSNLIQFNSTIYSCAYSAAQRQIIKQA
jgi:hypothetical protein